MVKSSKVNEGFSQSNGGAPNPTFHPRTSSGITNVKDTDEMCQLRTKHGRGSHGDQDPGIEIQKKVRSPDDLRCILILSHWGGADGALQGETAH